MATDSTFTVLGTTDQGRKVHLAWGTQGRHLEGKTLCDLSNTITTTVAAIPEGSYSVEVLLTLDIPVSRLCAHCFTPKTRKRYQQARTAAKAA